MEKKDFFKLIDKHIPLSTQDEWDNSGLQLDNLKADIDKVLLCLDVTGEVIDEAKEVGADFIVSHHPLLFSGLKTIENESVPGKFIFDLAAADIGVYSIHTPFDKVKGGNNDYFGNLMGFTEIADFTSANGFCKYGDLKKATTGREFLKGLKEIPYFSQINITYSGDIDDRIKRVGWCTGSGSEFYMEAKENGCQMFITGDVKHHVALDALESEIILVDMGHYGTEKLFPEAFKKIMEVEEEKLPQLISSKLDTNPLNVL
ncbi:dinuclear metal center protein, YbgI/SA1388 family [Peptostreptococcaceae bacterium pGA-8]|nr:dinuclear metal center protein, YbgI/SA1388 family [Peptostreptococcaceae bacterium pGA-8]